MIKGMDVSKWDGKGNWDIAKLKGIEFAYIRLGSVDDTTGVCYLDNLLMDHLSEAIRVGMPFGYYFYVRPKYSAQVQGDFILENVSILPEAALEFWIDTEVPGASLNATTDFLKNIHNILSVGKCPDMIYTRQSFWDSYVLADSLWPTLKLAAARYNSSLSSPWSDGKYVFRDWKTWKFWQFTESAVATDYGFPGGPTYSAGIDLDYYNGTIEDFKAEYSLKTPLEQLVEEVNELEQMVSVLRDSENKLKSGISEIQTSLADTRNSLSELRTSVEKLTSWAKGIEYIE